MNKLVKKMNNEDGQVMILMAFVIGILLISAALVVDIGWVSVTNGKLQNAADAAALAGALDLPNAGIANTTAIFYAGENGVKAPDTVTAQTPFEGDSTKIKVECKRTVSYTFARILGPSYKEKEVSASAIAQKYSDWGGDGLPFINVSNDYTNGEPLKIWPKVSSGFFSCIPDLDYTILGNPPNRFIDVSWEDGLTVENGTVASKKDILQELWARLQYDTVYVFSLSLETIESGFVNFTDGTSVAVGDIVNMNKQAIEPDQLVLLECTWDVYDDKDHSLTLTCNKVWEIGKGDIPPDYVYPPEYGTSRLVE